MLQKLDRRNKDIQVLINNKLFHRDKAKISVFDSVVQGGDAVWEGIRVYDGKIFCLDDHIVRLQESAKSLNFRDIPDCDAIKKAIFKTLKVNKMRDETHIRLTLTRGKKITSGMNPQLNQYGSTLIVLAEWKKPIFSGLEIRLITSSIRRNSPSFLDSKIHHANLLNNILAKIEANFSQVDDAIMLDSNGFVSETNSTNIFIIKDSVVFTPFSNSCLPGITRSVIIDLCKVNKILVYEKNLSISELYNADYVFTTGTMGELAPVIEIDGRNIERKGEDIFQILIKKFKDKTNTEGELLPF
ncbi:MAG: aminotransferase class IV [Bacteroidota bacterium]|nr:aminotransferase class IV [Bacteroidota bacterium]